MLQNFYHFREQPFGVNPDPRFLFLGRTHREAFASLLYRIEMDSGFLAMIAQPGMGKTTLLFHLLRRLQPTAKTAFIFQTQCTSNELLRHLLSEFECDTDITDPVRISRELKSLMLSEANAGRRCVLVIDEAQNLGSEVLETIRLLSNFETPRRKLLNIVLSGQSELGEMLGRPELQQLRQRLSCIVRIERFTPGETALYISHRLSFAGYPGKVSDLFNLHALAKIAQLSHGVPRIINNLCFNALSLGYALGRKQIELELIDEVASDLGLSGEPWTVPSMSPEHAQDSTEVLSEVSAVCDQTEHPALKAKERALKVTEPALKLTETEAQGRVSVTEVDRHTDRHVHDSDENRTASVTESRDNPVSSHTRAGPDRKVQERATLMARSGLCALVLLLTPAIDLPAHRSVSAHTIKAVSSAALELKTPRVEQSREPPSKNKTPGNVAKSMQGIAPHANSRRRLYVRHFTPRLHGDRKVPVDLALASFAPEPLLKSLPLTPAEISARAPVSIASSATNQPSASISSSHRTARTLRRPVGYVPPKPIWQPIPSNPYTTKHQYPTEDVQLVLFVSNNGNVYDVGVLKGDATLALAAENAVRKWKYTPALSNGTPVGSKIFVTVQFSRP